MEREGEWPQGYDGHRRAQRLRIARETTAEQRVQWLEDTLFFLWENGLIPDKFSEKELRKDGLRLEDWTEPHKMQDL